MQGVVPTIQLDQITGQDLLDDHWREEDIEPFEGCPGAGKAEFVWTRGGDQVARKMYIGKGTGPSLSKSQIVGLASLVIPEIGKGRKFNVHGSIFEVDLFHSLAHSLQEIVLFIHMSADHRSFQRVLTNSNCCSSSKAAAMSSSCFCEANRLMLGRPLSKLCEVDERDLAGETSWLILGLANGDGVRDGKRRGSSDAELLRSLVNGTAKVAAVVVARRAVATDCDLGSD